MAEDPNDLGFKVDQSYGTPNKAIDHAFKIIAEAAPPKARSRGRLTVCAAKDLPPGQRKIVTDGDSSIGVFNLDGKYYAVKNVCPHYGAPLCQGSLHGTHKPSDVHQFDPGYQGQILRCPWHGWEFDIVTGKGLYDRNSRVATYVVEVDEKGDVVVLV
jgi:3-phenylpropionate/trans-cinnamate dioxygenase ferredoxin subunit